MIDILYFAWVRERMGKPKISLKPRPKPSASWSKSCRVKTQDMRRHLQILLRFGWLWTKNWLILMLHHRGEEVAFFPP